MQVHANSFARIESLWAFTDVDKSIKRATCTRQSIPDIAQATLTLIDYTLLTYQRCFSTLARDALTAN